MRHSAFHAPRRSTQQGVVLLIALITLVAMTLAAIGLARSIDTGTLVAGNIGFRQSAVSSADAGIETASTWLVNYCGTTGCDFTVDNSAAGYYSTRQDNVDITGNRTATTADDVDWTGTDASKSLKAFDAGVDGTGNHIYYLVNRLCSAPGGYNAPNQDCSVNYGSGGGLGSTQRAVDTPDQPLFGVPLYTYRVTVRVDGPKNTTSYVQALLVN